jgi:microcystin-dependent protein
MKATINAKFFWIISTFSLLTLFLWSVTNPVNSGELSTLANTETKASSVSANPLLGEVIMFAGNFAPRGWAFCEGQLLPIAQYQALFSILGTTYGGDGRTTFALPDLRGRVAMHPRQGPGLSDYRLGQKGGSETVRFSQGTNVQSSTSGSTNAFTAASNASNLQPYTTVNYIIALQGIFPSRN